MTVSTEIGIDPDPLVVPKSASHNKDIPSHSSLLQDLCESVGASTGSLPNDSLRLSSGRSSAFITSASLRSSGDVQLQLERKDDPENSGHNDDLEHENHNREERGVIVTCNVKRGEDIMRIPIAACLRDDIPPEWLFFIDEDEGDDHHYDGGEDRSIDNDVITDSTHWETRLAASFLDKLLKSAGEPEEGTATSELWMKMLPEPGILRASLPVHWSEEAIEKTRCCALELAVDRAYFSREEAVSILMDRLQKRENVLYGKDELEGACHYALDIIQTRTCRVDRGEGWGPPLRMLVPVFDFINHGGKKRSNASFKLEEDIDEKDESGINDQEAENERKNPELVVRATRDLVAGEEIFLDYGDSAIPSWQCLVSYGFVPNFNTGDDNLHKQATYDDDEDEDEDVAEVFMDGFRYEVTASTVPFEMAQAASAALKAKGMGSVHYNPDEAADENPLTPEVALHIAKRISDVAFDLILEHEENEHGGDSPSSDMQAALAASLRWSQHRVLLDCAVGLRDYAAQEINDVLIRF